MTAQNRGWGPGWPNCQRNKLIWADAGNVRWLVRREILPLVVGFVNEIVNKGYPVNVVADDWGFACRAIAGTNVPSNHSWGLAIDVNATKNPMSSKLITDMPDWLPKVAAKWGFAWGGNYKTRPDAMHFEFIGTPQDVEVVLWKVTQKDKTAASALAYRGNLWEELEEDVEPTTVTDGCAVPDGPGTWRCNARGDVLPLQGAPPLKGLPELGVTPNAPIIAMAPYSNQGAWLAGADGGIFALGDAPALAGYLNIVGHIVGASVEDNSLVLIGSEGHAYNYAIK